MKPLSLLLAALLFVSCQGDPGPAGPEGPPGPAGSVGQAFEVEADFTESNEYTQFFDIPENIEVLDSDIITVYLLWEVDENAGDVWRVLPASEFFSDGAELQYAFDHTAVDIKLFMTGDVDLNTVGEAYTQNQIFRVAVLPVDYVESNNVDLSDMDAVMQAVDESKVERLQPVQ
ncbi:hypothetical protein [Fodinibius sediminis]|nr:hypothetical protein [Fodinibius sediminis]